MNYGADYDRYTVQDCIDLYEYKGQTVTIEDGKITKVN